LTNGEIFDAAELADMPDRAKEGLVPTSDEIKDRLRLRNFFIFPWLKKIRGEEHWPSFFWDRQKDGEQVPDDLRGPLLDRHRPTADDNPPELSLLLLTQKHFPISPNKIHSPKKKKF
jgi:hypothetical protein